MLWPLPSRHVWIALALGWLAAVAVLVTWLLELPPEHFGSS